MLKNFIIFLCIGLAVVVSVLALKKPETVHVTQLDDTRFENFIQKADKPVIIDFWATWCAPCMQMKPLFEQLAKEFKDQYRFVSVNIDECQQTAKKYGVVSIPTFKVIKNNDVVGTFMGCTSKDTFLEHIDNAINKKLTLNTLISAIQTEDKELVATCLAHKEIDVNGTTQIPVLNVEMPMTPLMMATSLAIFGPSSPEIVSMLLQAGAQIDLEIDSPQFDASKAVTGWGKVTVRLVVEETAKGKSEEELAAIDNDNIRQWLLECQAKAASILELFQTVPEQDSLSSE